jgi:predicted nucleic acid-binding protein
LKLVDTTVAVDHLRGVPAATELLAGLISEGETVVASEITRFELLRASERPNSNPWRRSSLRSRGLRSTKQPAGLQARSHIA